MKNLPLLLREFRKYSGNAPSVGFSNPFQVLVSTILSQRTRDANTEKASKQLFSKYPDAKALARAPLRNIEKLIKPAGFYRVKSRRIKKIAVQLMKNFSGKVPASREQLLSLVGGGIGPKTAACVIVYGFKKPELPVDVHVHRISNRLGIVETKTPEKTEIALKQIVPKKFWIELNHLMVRFGQKICFSRNPKCNLCGLKKICKHYKTIVKPREKK